MKKRYSYSIMTLADAQPNQEVFVPNCSSDETMQIWRYLSGKRKDFPKYKDHSLMVSGVDEDAWCPPKVYMQAFAPLTMACIVRHA